MDDQIVYDPRGVVHVQTRPLARRATQLNGLRLAVLDNTKWNANKLLRRCIAKLEDLAVFASINYYRKESFSRIAPSELISVIAANNDLVLTAIGD
jgi:hypothetical protein